MKKLSICICLSVLSLALVRYSLLAQSVDEKCHQQERGGCPFKLGAIPVLDRCTGSLTADRTDFGNMLCDAFNKAEDISGLFNKGVNSYKEQARQNLLDHLKPIFKDAIDPQALDDFNQASRFYMEICNELLALIKDQYCGPNQLKNIQNFFKSQLDNLLLAKSTVETGLRIFGTETSPALQALADFTTELSNAVRISGSNGGEGLTELKKIQSAINTLDQQLGILKDLDPLPIVANTADLGVQVGGLYGSCTACAGAMVTGIVEIQKAFAEGGSSVAAAPETAEVYGGSLWLAPVAGLDAAAAALVSLSSPVACGAMIESIKHIEDDINALKAYYGKLSRLATSVKECLTIIEDAATNLEKLRKSASKQIKPSLDKMTACLSKVDKQVDNIFERFNKDLLPKVARLSIQITKQVADNAGHLYDCFQQYMDISERITDETIAGMHDMMEAGLKIVDAARIMDNMGAGVNQAVNAARNKAALQFTTLKNSYTSLEKSLFIVRTSNGSLDINGTARAIQANVNVGKSPLDYYNSAKAVVNRSTEFLRELGDLVKESMETGDAAYTNKPGIIDKVRAIQKSKDARGKAHAAMLSIRKATKREYARNKAKEEAKRKMRESLDKARNDKQVVADNKLTERKKLAILP